MVLVVGFSCLFCIEQPLEDFFRSLSKHFFFTSVTSEEQRMQRAGVASDFL